MKFIKVEEEHFRQIEEEKDFFSLSENWRWYAERPSDKVKSLFQILSKLEDGTHSGMFLDGKPAVVRIMTAKIICVEIDDAQGLRIVKEETK